MPVLTKRDSWERSDRGVGADVERVRAVCVGGGRHFRHRAGGGVCSRDRRRSHPERFTGKIARASVLFLIFVLVSSVILLSRERVVGNSTIQIK